MPDSTLEYSTLADVAVLRTTHSVPFILARFYCKRTHVVLSIFTPLSLVYLKSLRFGSERDSAWVEWHPAAQTRSMFGKVETDAKNRRVMAG